MTLTKLVEQWRLDAQFITYNPERRSAFLDAARALEEILDDIAYMPVPRCDSCRHWDKDVSEPDQGSCLKIYGHDDSKMWPTMYDGINTAADFGCVQWEAK